jgi:hypothetical protein
VRKKESSGDTHIDVLEVIGIVLVAIIERRQVAEATTLKQQEEELRHANTNTESHSATHQMLNRDISAYAHVTSGVTAVGCGHRRRFNRLLLDSVTVLLFLSVDILCDTNTNTCTEGGGKAKRVDC